jgi:hypothetical protein
MSTHSNSCLNSLSHGGAAESLFIPGENPADFEALLHHAFAEHQPSSDQHSAFVYDSVHARWMLARRQRTTAAYEVELHKQMPDPSHWPNESLTRLNLFDRYKTQAERALRRAFVNLQAVRKDIFNEHLWSQKLAIQKERLALERLKFEARCAPRQKPPQEPAEDLKQDLKTYQASSAPIQRDPALNCHVIAQRAFIRLEDGASIIDQLIPPNDHVRQLIENRAHFENEPKLLVRYCTFLKDNPAGLSFLRREISFAEFYVLALQEDREISAQPPAEDPETILSDQEWLAAQRRSPQ